jgi:hypothetical protein
MTRKSRRVSLLGQRLIREAKIKKGWKISEDNPRLIKEASRFLLIQYAKKRIFK